MTAFLSEQLAKAERNLAVTTDLWSDGHATSGEADQALAEYAAAEAAYEAACYPAAAGLQRRDPAGLDRVTYRGQATDLIAEGELGTVAAVQATGCLYVQMDDGGRVKGLAQSWVPLTDDEGRVIKRALPVR